MTDRELLLAARNALNLAVPIIGKVIADDLMPDIVAPNYPKMTLDNINAILAEIDANGTA